MFVCVSAPVTFSLLDFTGQTPGFACVEVIPKDIPREKPALTSSETSRTKPSIQIPKSGMVWVAWLKTKSLELEGSPSLGVDFADPHPE